MKNMSTLLLFVFTASICSYSQRTRTPPIDITVFTGKSLMENAFLLTSDKKLVLIDALASASASEEICLAIRGKKLHTIFITHGHPDHFMGLATILKEHPQADVYVGSEEVKNDIIRYITLATANGWLDSNTAMKIKSTANPMGFDYGKITVARNNLLDIGNGNTLSIENITQSAECSHNTILYSKELNLLFASDLLYNKIFNWLGDPEPHAIEHWIDILEDLKDRFGKQNALIFPGHGQQHDQTLFDTNINYLRSFKDILGRTRDKKDAEAFFKRLYPDYRGEFLLSRSIDQWIGASRPSDYISIRHIQDLTHTLDSDFPFIPVPGVTFPFEAKPIATMEDHGVRANRWIIHEHIGTQIDAPSHFAPDGIALESLKVESLIVPVIVIDIVKKSSVSADAELTVEDIQQWERVYGKIPDRACVMMYSGWEIFLHDKKYLGLDETHTKHFPGISEAAIRFLVTEREISGVGVDVISIDPGYDGKYKGHKILLGANKWALEAVAKLKMIPPMGAYLIVGAPKIKGATGGIVRLLAVW